MVANYHNSSCLLSLPRILCTEIRDVSSANSLRCEWDIQIYILLWLTTIIKNSMGPKTDPSETPVYIITKFTNYIKNWGTAYRTAVSSPLVVNKLYTFWSPRLFILKYLNIRYNYCHDNILCNCEVIEQTDRVKYSGVVTFIDEKFSLKPHVNRLHKSLRNNIRQFMFKKIF